MAQFIWNGGLGKNSFHLAKSDVIAAPKESGGWGIIEQETFGTALLMKSFWRCLTGFGIWKNIMDHKYFNQNSLEDLFLGADLLSEAGSLIWKGFRKISTLFKARLSWQREFDPHLVKDHESCGGMSPPL